MNAPKMKPMIIAWIRASGEIPVNIPLMAAIAPELESVFMIRNGTKNDNEYSECFKETDDCL